MNAVHLDCVIVVQVCKCHPKYVVSFDCVCMQLHDKVSIAKGRGGMQGWTIVGGTGFESVDMLNKGQMRMTERAGMKGKARRRAV